MTRNKIFTLFGLILVLSIVGYYFFQRQTPKGPKLQIFNGDATVNIGNDNYTPDNFQIKKGSKVTFVNNSDTLRWPASDLHPSHLIYPEFDPKQPIAKGGSWTFEFDKVGEWGFHDHLAPYITGTIKVVD